MPVLEHLRSTQRVAAIHNVTYRGRGYYPNVAVPLGKRYLYLSPETNEPSGPKTAEWLSSQPITEVGTASMEKNFTPVIVGFVSPLKQHDTHM